VYDVELTQDGTVYRTAEDYQGNMIDLALDVWEPVGDPADQLRPVLLWMHGGYFEYGDRTGDQEVFEDFASRGFVVVSIDYRLQPVPSGSGLAIPLEDAVVDTREDAVAAVQWIHANAAGLRIDPASVVASGYSAGAITALGLAHEPTPVSAAGTTTPIAAAVAFSGVDMYRTQPARSGDKPVLMYNGEEDGIVPIGSARSACKTTVVAGSECDFVPLPNEGHTSGDPDLYQQSVGWLAAHGITQLAACEPFDLAPVDYSTTTTSSPPSTSTTTTTTAVVDNGTATPATPIAGTSRFTG
jgi:acetyl esterase/lipase